MNTAPVYVPAAPELLLGNTDLADSCQWVPRDVLPNSTPLPIYPAPADLCVELVSG